MTVSTLEKYELVDDVRIHNEYTPATAPVSTTLKVISVDEENTELTLVTTLVGVPVHALDEMTNADESPDTFTNPAPFTTIACPVALKTEIALGVNEVTEMMLKAPIKKYGDTALHRPHN